MRNKMLRTAILAIALLFPYANTASVCTVTSFPSDNTALTTTGEFETVTTALAGTVSMTTLACTSGVAGGISYRRSTSALI